LGHIVANVSTKHSQSWCRRCPCLVIPKFGRFAEILFFGAGQLILTEGSINHSHHKIMKKNQHVVPADSGWAVRGAGNERRTSIHETQAQAIAAGREIARNQHSELLIHGRDGQIRARDSYGDDAYPPPG
jgi:hypothetical protein